MYLFSFSRVVIQYPGELPVRQDTPSGFTGNSMVRSHKRRMGYIRPCLFDGLFHTLIYAKRRQFRKTDEEFP